MHVIFFLSLIVAAPQTFNFSTNGKYTTQISCLKKQIYLKVAGSNIEGSVINSQGTSVSVVGTAQTFAQINNDLVHTGFKDHWGILRGIVLNFALGLDRVLARSKTLGNQFTKAHGHGANRDNSEGDFTSTGLVENGEEGSNVEGGALGTSLGLDDSSVKLSASGSSAVIDGAELDFLAQPDGVQISLLDQFDKGLDTNAVTNQIASQNSQLAKVGNVVAQCRAGTNDANVQDDIQQLVNGLVHNVNASGAQVKTGLGLFNVEAGGSDGDRDLLAAQGSKGNNSKILAHPL